MIRSCPLNGGGVRWNGNGTFQPHVDPALLRTNRAARRGAGQFPAGYYTSRVDQRRIQSGPNVGRLEWRDARLTVKPHSEKFMPDLRLRMRKRKTRGRHSTSG